MNILSIFIFFNSFGIFEFTLYPSLLKAIFSNPSVIILHCEICFISDLVKKEFKTYPLLNDTTDLIYMKRGRSGFELEFSPIDVLDDPECGMEDTIDRCPNKKAYLTNIHYSNCEVAKRILNLIKDMFGEMYIQSDEYDNWFGTVQEYINNYKDEVFPWQK